jgi:hypothetical protein
MEKACGVHGEKKKYIQNFGGITTRKYTTKNT